VPGVSSVPASGFTTGTSSKRRAYFGSTYQRPCGALCPIWREKGGVTDFSQSTASSVTTCV
jgi:hypothetical protein